MNAMEELDALLEGVYAHAGDVARSPTPEKLLRELLDPVRVLFLTQIKARELHSLSISSDAVAQANGEDAADGAADPAKRHNYLSEAATKIQALVLGSSASPSAANGAQASRVSTIRHSIAVPRMSKLNFEAAKMPRAHNYLSGAANKLQALVKGNRGGLPPAPPATIVERSPTHDRSEAAVRIQALVRGKQERNTLLRQHSFLEQGTKVLKKYVMKSDRFPNCHVLSTPDGYNGGSCCLLPACLLEVLMEMLTM